MCGIAGTYDDPIAEPEFRATIGALAHAQALWQLAVEYWVRAHAA